MLSVATLTLLVRAHVCKLFLHCMCGCVYMWVNLTFSQTRHFSNTHMCLFHTLLIPFSGCVWFYLFQSFTRNIFSFFPCLPPEVNTGEIQGHSTKSSSARKTRLKLHSFFFPGGVGTTLVSSREFLATAWPVSCRRTQVSRLRKNHLYEDTKHTFSICINITA